MFKLLDVILRPPSPEFTYKEAKNKVRLFFDHIDKVFDDEFSVREGKEKEAQDLSVEVERFIAEARGSEYSWPCYNDASTEILKTINKRFLEDSPELLAKEGLPHRGKLNQARRTYAQNMATIFIQEGRKQGDSSGRWDCYAARAIALLSPLGPDRGLWPLPTERTLADIPEILAPHQLGITEVSNSHPSTRFVSATADSADMPHHCGMRRIS